MPKAAFYTLGCKVNQYDTQGIVEQFEQNGYQIVGFDDNADVYVVNTCTVTNISARKSRQMIRRAKRHNKKAIVVVMGCYAQISPKELEGLEDVDIVLGTNKRGQLLYYIDQVKKNRQKISIVDDIKDINQFEEIPISGYQTRTRAFVKIQEGCNQFCSYCIIPYARGRIRSRNQSSIINEVKKLSSEGYKEIVLTGIHIASYGLDTGESGLIDVIEAINEISGIERIRLSSVDPRLLTDEFIERVSIITKMCPHYHVSLQSGCNKILRDMNRRYTTEEYETAIMKLKSAIPNVSVTTDIIVGFPGETADDFKMTCDFVKRIKFSQIHIFKFSPRKGTHAALLDNQVNSKVKEQRSRQLNEIAQQLKYDFMISSKGKKAKVLFEQESPAIEGYYEGHTDNYIKVLSKSDYDIINKIMDVKLTKIFNESIIGDIVQ
ncbi:MAG: tRNA (N(6)-L-threonylcarbamoyladenosine(37)-C(2))-methylthiotransferase MtaB [Clostridia bacterium]|nr:tRNA (N(6)-L-threonylcarbamoyladenosine(37)-C(2))-methylthiotransferase MtaB [Clostridia bacterium]